MKKRIVLIIALFMMILSGCSTKAVVKEETNKEATKNKSEISIESENNQISFVDDLGEQITLDKPAQKIISLYSVHTENLFSLGLSDEIIGVSTNDKYPKDVENKNRYTYKDDPELIIAADPDVVIIRTMIANKYPDYVNVLKNAGIKVVTLYARTYDEFDSYIEKLGLITGKDEEAKALLEKFHSEIDVIKEKLTNIDEPIQNVYFESIGSKFKTATPESFAGKALEILNLNNIAADVEHNNTSTVVEFGEENLLANGDKIDLFIAQKGVMNKGVSIDKIKERPGFNQIKAIKNGKIIIIDEKLISGATMRYIEGLNQLISQIYPQI